MNYLDTHDFENAAVHLVRAVVHITEINEMSNKTIPESEAMSLLKSMQGSTEVVIPLIINQQQLHPGIKFEVSLHDYNAFIDETQSGKTTTTAASKNLLMRCVSKEHENFLIEALKVKGVLNNFMGHLTSKIQPEFGESLD